MGLYFFHSILLGHELATLEAAKKGYKIKRRKPLGKGPDRKIYFHACRTSFSTLKTRQNINWGRKEKGRATTSEKNEEEE